MSRPRSEESRRPLTKAQQELVQENVGLAYYWANRLGKLYNVDADELLGATYEGLIRAVKKWEPDKGRLSTYSAFWMRSFVQKELLTKEGKRKNEREVPLSTAIGKGLNLLDTLVDVTTPLPERFEMVMLEERFRETLRDEKAYRIWVERILLRGSCTEVARRLQCHRSYVDRVARRLQRRWKRFLKSGRIETCSVCKIPFVPDDVSEVFCSKKCRSVRMREIRYGGKSAPIAA